MRKTEPDGAECIRKEKRSSKDRFRGEERLPENPSRGKQRNSRAGRWLLSCLAAAAFLLMVPGISAHAAETVTGSFAAEEGKDIATIRYYTNAERTEYAFADFTRNESTGEYEYSFEAPYSGFAKSEGTENVGESYEGTATVIAEYFSTEKWDGAVDVSWYNETSSDFTIDTPAELAGLAAIVNGSLSSGTKDYQVKGDQSYIASTYDENADLIAGATGPAHIGLASHDFSNRTVHLAADLDMGGTDGSEIEHTGYNDTKNQYDYPNWAPIGGEYPMDPADKTTMCIASFNGTLDGGGHRITNLYCYRYAYEGWQYCQGVGLIGSMGVLSTGEENPTVSPTVKNLSVSGYVYGRRMVGGIIGEIGGGKNAISNDSISGSVNFENLASHVWVYNTDSKGIGGILGSAYVDSGSVINCYFDGQVSTTYGSPAGGIIGANEHMDIFCCYSRGTVKSGTAHVGRGIGGTGNSPGNFTVNSCYYIKGGGDDTQYPGYYTYNLPDSVSITVTEMTDSQMKDGTLLEALNVNGTAYVEGDSGYPVLRWEKESGTGSLTIESPTGGTVTGTASGTQPLGTVVYLTVSTESGWNFRYFTLNGEEMTGDYVTVSENTEVSAFLESAKAGVLKIVPNSVCTISVKKNGVVKQEDGSFANVKGLEVTSGDPLYEGDSLMVTATLNEGAVPDDESMDYSAAVGLSNPYTYVFTYTGGEPDESSSPVYTVDDQINAENVSLSLEVVPLTTPKLWRNLGDTSWYTGNSTSYELTTAAQLAGLDVLVEGGNTFSGITVSLGADISLKNTDGTSGIRSWDGIGDDATSFAGTFDGNGHKITDYHGISGGLFAGCEGASADSPALVKDVAVYGSGSGTYAAGIAGSAKNTEISGCSSYVTITDASQYAGGILARDNSGTKIRSCFNYGEISATGRVGGLAGRISSSGEIQDSINKGAIHVGSSSGNQVGGLAGELNGALVRCANYADVTASGRNIGGAVGEMTAGTSSLTDCYNVGDVTCVDGTSEYDSLGGLVGYGSYYSLTNCFNYGSVTASGSTTTGHTGSVIGRNSVKSGNSIQNVYTLDSANADGYAADGRTREDLVGENSEYYGTLYEADAAAFRAADGVLKGINGNGSFTLTDAPYPELAAAGSAHRHSGGEATCVSRAVCEVCGLPYGEVDPDNHEGETEIRNAEDAVWVYDGYTGDTYCAACGALLETGETIPADRSKEVITFVIHQEGREDVSKTFTAEEFDSMKTTGQPIGYMYGAESKTLMAATEYVTLEDVLGKFGVLLTDVSEMTVTCDGAAPVISGDELRSCNLYFDKDGNSSAAPPAFAIKYGAATGTLETAAAIAKYSDNIRFGYGISQEQYDDKVNTGGRRLVSPVRTVDVTVSGKSKTATVSGTISGTDSTVHIQLASSDPAVPAFETDAVGTYQFDSVEYGTYTMTVSGTDFLTREYTVNVDQDAVTKDIALLSYGDVNGDGELASSDLVVLSRHVAKISEIEDPYTLGLADVNRDGAVNSQDIVSMARYLAGITDEP